MKYDLTVFFITFLMTNSKSLLSLRGQSYKDFYVNIIKNVSPMSEAFNEMHRRCLTPYFIQLDEDMILDKTAVERLYNAIKISSPKVYMVYGQLYQPDFGLGGSVKCWKKDIFNRFQFNDVRCVDRDFHNRVKKYGFRKKEVKHKGHLFGVHSA